MLHTPTQAAAWLHQRVQGSLRTDSRQIAPGDGFVAWPGAAVDGRSFVASALNSGASGALVEHEGADAFALGADTHADKVARYAGLKAAAGLIADAYYQHPSQELQVLAVTGTNGKTSTAWWLAQALTALQESSGKRCALVGTLGVGFAPALDAPDPALAPELVATGLTTPDPVLLHQSLRAMADAGASACAIEASSIGIEEHRLDGVQIRVAVFTNFTQDHLDYHGSMDAYWQAKRRLFAWPGLQSVVLNVDDARGLELAHALQDSALDVWTVSTQRAARLQARDIGYDSEAMQFTVVEGDTALPLRTALIGSYNIANLLGVIGALRSRGIALADAVRVCSQLRPVPGRMECLAEPGQPLVAVDYAHTPDALDHALAALRPLVQARAAKLWCVFGCGGDRDNTKRPLMGAIAARQADHVVVTSDNPRSEKPEAIIAQILRGMPAGHPVVVEADRAAAIAYALAQAQAQDVVLIAGKGHEQEQEVCGVKTPFSDRSHALAALQRRYATPTGVRP